MVFARFVPVVGFMAAFVKAQGAGLVNGQYFTNGLAISNAPAPLSEHTVGGTIGISVDVSGNGHLSPSAWGPDSEDETGYISLNIFLVGEGNNVTVISGPEWLAAEEGSTVKHGDGGWVIPDCLAQGEYEYTYYEVSRIGGETYFSITPIPIRILNPSGSSGPCDASFSHPLIEGTQEFSAIAAEENPIHNGVTVEPVAWPSGASSIVHAQMSIGMFTGTLMMLVSLAVVSF